MRTPEPFVTLDEFGATGLSFTLYAFIADITKAGSVKTNLSMGILEAFSAAGIVIPFGQVDVAIRKMEWLRELIAGGASPPAGDGSGNGQTRPRASMSP
jgi:small-conductance mechanosensitive channel